MLKKLVLIVILLVAFILIGIAIMAADAIRENNPWIFFIGVVTLLIIFLSQFKRTS